MLKVLSASAVKLETDVVWVGYNSLDDEARVAVGSVVFIEAEGFLCTFCEEEERGIEEEVFGFDA